MTELNIYVLIYLAAVCSGNLVYLLARGRWVEGVFGLLRKETGETLERKLFGFDESMTPVIITDEDGLITNVNKAMFVVFRWTENELVGQQLDKIIPARFYEAHKSGMAKMKGKAMEDRIYHLYAKKNNGAEFPIELRLRKSMSGGRFFYLAEIADTTSWVIKEGALKEELAAADMKLKILTKGEEIGKTGSWFWDLSTGKLSVSDGYREILGLDARFKYDASYLKSRVWSEDADIVDHALKEAFDGKPYSIKFRQVRSSDLKIIYVESKTEPVTNEDNVVVGMFGSLRLLQTLNIIDANKIPVTDGTV